MHLKYPEMTRAEEREFRLKARLYRKVHEYLSLDVQGVGDLDLSLGWPFLKENYAGASFPLVCANLVEKSTGKAPFPGYKILERGGLKVAFIGLLSRDEDAHLPYQVGELLEVTDPDEALKRTLKELDVKKPDLRILLSHLGRNEEIRIGREVPGLDLILGGHSGDIMQVPVLTAGIPIVQAGRRGKRIGRIDLWINLQGAPGAEEYRDFKTAKRKTKAQFSKRIAYVNRIQQVKKAMEFDPVVDTWIKEYKAEIAALPPLVEEPQDLEPEEPELPVESRYWGSDTCSKCHVKQAEWWKKTRHAHAFQTLVKAGTEKSADCIGCHSVGYKDPGGFMQPTDVGKFRNVSCENCHGRGDDHGQEEKFNTAPRSPATCTACHTQDQDPHWDPAKIDQIACPSLSEAPVQNVLPSPSMTPKPGSVKRTTR
jgi:hypothetical protein